MNPEPAPPEPQHESLLTFLLTHPATPLVESLPEPKPAPRPSRRAAPLRSVKSETITLYAQGFRELEAAGILCTSANLALRLGSQVTNILRTLRVLERLGYIRVCGRHKSSGPKPAMIWEWRGSRDGAPPLPPTS